MNVLFVQSGKTSLSEMLPLGRYLHEKENFNCYLTSSKKNVEALLGRERLDGFSVVSIDMYAKRINTFINKVPVINKIFNEQTRTRFCKKLLKDLEIDIVLLYCDFNASDELSYIKACNAIGIKTIAIPIAFSNPSFMAKHRIDTKKHLVLRGIKKLLITKFFPLQFYSFGGTPVLFYSLEVMFRLYLNGVLPKNPWIIGGGDSNYVFVQNEQIKNNLIQHGVESEKILVTGQFTTDSMYKNGNEKKILKKMIVDKYELNRQKKILIFALPQLSEHGLMSKRLHHQELQYIISVLCQLDINILCSLHPKMNKKDYLYLEINNQCKLIDERLSEILPCADGYIGCFESTTVWAHELGIPSLFINYFDLGYNMNYLKNLIICNNKNEFLNDCKLLLNQPYQLLQNDGFIDGNARIRIIQGLKEVCSKSKEKEVS